MNPPEGKGDVVTSFLPMSLSNGNFHPCAEATRQQKLGIVLGQIGPWTVSLGYRFSFIKSAFHADHYARTLSSNVQHSCGCGSSCEKMLRTACQGVFTLQAQVMRVYRLSISGNNLFPGVYLIFNNKMLPSISQPLVDKFEEVQRYSHLVEPCSLNRSGPLEG